MCRFGYALIDEARIVHREPDVLARFERALAAGQALYAEST